MAKTAKATAPVAEAKPARAPKNTVSVVYQPLEHPGGSYDPPVVKWNGITFRANVPVDLDPDNEAHYIEQLVPKTYPGQNGETLTKHVPARVFMGDLARNNPSFEVDGKRARRKVNTRKVPPPGAEWTEAHEGQISYSDEIDRSVAA